MTVIINSVFSHKQPKVKRINVALDGLEPTPLVVQASTLTIWTTNTTGFPLS